MILFETTNTDILDAIYADPVVYEQMRYDGCARIGSHPYRFSNAVYVAAAEGGVVMGALTLRLERERWWSHIAIAPAHRIRAGEIVALMRQYVSGRMPVRKIYAKIPLWNKRSVSFAKKIGFTPTSSAITGMSRDGEYHESLTMRLDLDAR